MQAHTVTARGCPVKPLWRASRHSAHQDCCISFVVHVGAAEEVDTLASALPLDEQLVGLPAEAVRLAQVERPEVGKERLVQLRFEVWFLTWVEEGERQLLMLPS
eukprot:1158298-Pelagomonas_calceolata.AAC.13